MGKYEVVYSRKFDKALDRLSPADQDRVLDKIEDLAENPYYPSFRTKPFYGFGEERYESRISRDLRIFWRFKTDEIIFLIDVGHHDLVK